MCKAVPKKNEANQSKLHICFLPRWQTLNIDRGVTSHPHPNYRVQKEPTHSFPPAVMPIPYFSGCSIPVTLLLLKVNEANTLVTWERQ